MCSKLHYSEPRHPTLREWETTVRTKRGIGTGEGVGDKKGVREARERQELETCDLIMIILIMFINMLSIHYCEHSGIIVVMHVLTVMVGMTLHVGMLGVIRVSMVSIRGE